MNIDYNDQRFQQVNNEKQARLNEVNNTYNNMINQSEQYYNDLSKATEEYGQKQQELQQQRTDFAIDQINQQKEWAKQDYTKEQKGAYQDYMKQTNNYGSNAEQMASNGLLGTGYAESSKVSMYNTYQNRVATARESFNRSISEYDNSIKEAQIANNATMAELAFNTLKTKLEYSLQGFQYKNDLLQTQLQAQDNVEDRYYSRWKDVLSQINNEKQFEYQKAIDERNFAYQQERDRIADEQWKKQYALSLSKASSGSSKSGGSKINKGNSNESGNENLANAVMTPKLSKKSYDWYEKNFSSSMSVNDINNAIALGLSNGMLEENDIDKIYNAYQLTKKSETTSSQNSKTTPKQKEYNFSGSIQSKW